MNTQRVSHGKPRPSRLHCGTIATIRAALLVLCLTEVFSILAESGRLLSRSEIVVSDDMLGAWQVTAGFSNTVQRVRFWKFTYESDGLKVCGYMVPDARAVRCLVSLRIAAVVIGSGEVELEEEIRLRPEMETNVIAELVPGYATSKARALRARSAIHRFEKLAKDTPILPLAGTEDRRVNPMNLLRVSEKLYQQRHPFRLVMFEGGDHGLLEHGKERDRIVLDWFNNHLRGASRVRVSTRTTADSL